MSEGSEFATRGFLYLEGGFPGTERVDIAGRHEGCPGLAPQTNPSSEDTGPRVQAPAEGDMAVLSSPPNPALCSHRRLGDPVDTAQTYLRWSWPLQPPPTGSWVPVLGLTSNQ